MTTQFIINHLWQSSCFALLAGLLAFVLRKNSPKVRYWVWLSASLKFLMPFALLVSLGSMVPRPAPHPVSIATPVFQNTLVQIAEPFSPASKATVPAHAPIHWVLVAIGVVWALGSLAITLARCRSWLGVRAALRASTPIELPIPIRALITPGAGEPGIFGFLRPVLVLPVQLLEHLNPRQLGAILAHEMCHVRRRDNFFAAVHMVVEAIFWFLPLVWWIGSHLVEERELACDEEVLRMGCEPADYVEGILKVCRFYTESPLPCISGVTGADVKKRLRAILAGSVAPKLTVGKRFTLAAIGLAVLAAPIVIGVLNAPTIRAQSEPRPKFEVASIRPCKDPSQEPPTGHRPGSNSSPGRLATDCVELLNLMGNAYNAFADGHLNLNAEPAPMNGGPPWLHSAFYEINARAEGNPSVEMMFGPMMQELLEDRFQLKMHRQKIEGPVYFLTIARGGQKLHPFTEGSCTPYSTFPPPPLQPGQKYCERIIGGIPPAVEAQGATLDEFSKTLRMLVDRPVIDKTGITGRFDIRVEFSREGTEPASDPTGPPSIFTALQEQLGLRLESGKGPVDTLVIDHIQRPSEN
jgi:bla regulator protein blaR1